MTCAASRWAAVLSILLGAAPAPAEGPRVSAQAGDVGPATTSKGDRAAGGRAAAESDDAKAHARALFDNGVTAYAEGRYFEAIDAFLEVGRIFPNPQLSFNVAKAYDNWGDQAGALRYYREYLKHVPDAADRKDVYARIRQIEQALAQKGVQQLTVSSQPDAAMVLLDGRPVGLTPWTGETWPGRHRVQLESAGYRPEERVIELERHRSQDVAFALTPALARAAGPTPSQRPPGRDGSSEPRSRHGSVGMMTWALLATSAVSLAGALAYQASQSEADGAGLARTSAFLAGAGTAAGVAGGIMLCFDLQGARPVDVSAIGPSALRPAF